jgi:hypothetical protein
VAHREQNTLRHTLTRLHADKTLQTALPTLNAPQRCFRPRCMARGYTAAAGVWTSKKPVVSADAHSIGNNHLLSTAGQKFGRHSDNGQAVSVQVQTQLHHTNTGRIPKPRHTIA